MQYIYQAILFLKFLVQKEDDGDEKWITKPLCIYYLSISNKDKKMVKNVATFIICVNLLMRKKESWQETIIIIIIAVLFADVCFIIDIDNIIS